MRTKKLPDDWPISIIQLLAVPGMIIAFFLLLYHNGNLIEVCSASGWDDCGKVSGPDGAYSAIGPFPVALIGLIGYGAIFLAIWLRDWWAFLNDYLPELLVGLTGLAFLISVGLTALELFIIHAICRYCVISAVIVTVMFILAISFYRGAGQARSEASD
jgi:uncharacterized membrane protein